VPCSSLAWPGGRDLDLDGLFAAEEPGREQARHDDRGANGEPQAEARRRSVRRRITVDAQFLEEFRFIHAFWSVWIPGPRSVP
jgi:hypothetical protein